MKGLQARSSQHISGPVASRDLALRAHPLVFGMVVFLASDLMIFGGFIAGYFNLKSLTDVWPPAGVHLDEFSAAVGTALLGCSSLTMLFASHFIARNRFTIARLWLGTTMLLGTAFVYLSLHGWTVASFRVNTNAYGSIYYTMLGFHIFHVTTGVLLMTMLFFNMRQAAFQRDRRAGVEAIGFFWHFVFGIWLLIWGSIFVIR